MFRLGPLELGIILAIVVLLFVIGRISKIGGELGRGIRSFKDGLKSNEGEKSDSVETEEKTGKS